MARSPKNLVAYGGFEFWFHTMMTNQDVLYGDNKIDVIGLRYTFTIRSWLSAPTPAAMAELIAQAQCQLGRPRQQFSVAWSDDGGATYTPYFVFDATNDIDNGPKPGDLVIERISGGCAAMFSWQITCVSKQCFDGNCNRTTASADVLTISRKFAFEVDMSGLTVRTVTGRLEITSSAVARGIGADAYRQLVNISTPSGYQRMPSHFLQSPDGRLLDYLIVDREEVWTLPPPVTEGMATFRVEVEPLGLRARYSLSGVFKGPKSASKLDIINQIIQLANNRMPPIQGALAVIPKEKTLSESVYENEVTFTFVSEGSIGATADPNDPSTGYATFGIAPPNSNGVSQSIGVYGGTGVTNSGVIAGVPIPYDACGASIPPQGLSLRLPNIPATGASPPGPNSPGSPTAAAPPYQSQDLGISQAHMQATYTAYCEKVSFRVDNQYILFYPKVAGLGPITQRIGNPKIFVDQVGRAKRYGLTAANAPAVPPPVLSEQIAKLHTKSITLGNPVPIGSGLFNEYSVDWVYSMEYAMPITQSTSVAVAYPDDPRRPPGQQNTISNITLATPVQQ